MMTTLDPPATRAPRHAMVASQLRSNAVTDERIVAAMASIPQVSTALILLGYKESATARAPQNHGYLVPRAERRKVKAVTWMSSKLANRAPEGLRWLPLQPSSDRVPQTS